MINGTVTIRMARYEVHVIALTESSIATSTRLHDTMPDLRQEAEILAARYQEGNGYFRPAIAICGNQHAAYNSRASGASILGDWRGGLPRYVVTRRRIGEPGEPGFLPNVIYLTNEHVEGVANNLSGTVSIFVDHGRGHEFLHSQRMEDGRRIILPPATRPGVGTIGVRLGNTRTTIQRRSPAPHGQ